MLKFMKVDNIRPVDLQRIGKYDPSKSRPIVVKFQTVWDTGKIMSQVKLLKNYDTKGIFVSQELSPFDRRKEKAILKKRYELIQNGTSKKELKIRNLKLYHNNVEVNCMDS